MEKVSKEKQINLGWKCNHCGAFNKVSSAKFCGSCGTKRVYVTFSDAIKSIKTTSKPIQKKVEPLLEKPIERVVSEPKIEEKAVISEVILQPETQLNIQPETEKSIETTIEAKAEIESIENEQKEEVEKSIQSEIDISETEDELPLLNKKEVRPDLFSKLDEIFFGDKDSSFHWVATMAVCILLVSVVTGYKMFISVDSIRLSKCKFSDVAVDHPVYEVCHNLLGINAIGFRKNKELAPYESISATEWNHVLHQASKHLKKDFDSSAFFSKNDSVTVESLNSKLRNISSNSPELPDMSRIQSFYFLEQTLFNQI